MSQRPPNILFIMADQMAAPILPLHREDSPILMPHLGALAAAGTVFDSAYCNSPLCAPSRFSLVTGQLPSRIGAYDNAADLAADIPTYAHHLRRLGYRTALSGKMHFCGPDQLHGYEERLTSDIYPADYGWTVNWDQPDVRPSWYHNMSSVLQAGTCVRTNQLDFDEEVMYRARQYLYDHVRNTPAQPFCLTVSMTHPHDPYTIPAAYFDRYTDAQIEMPRHVLPQDQLDPHAQRLARVIDIWGKTMPEEAIRRARRAYYGACSYIDDNIGLLVQTLQACGLSDNTIVVFSGDHGDMLGERGLWYKMHWYEMAARVPLVVHVPGRFAPGRFLPGRVRQSVSSIDLLPTLVELAGGTIDPQLPLDGRSLVPHLQGLACHDEAIGEYMAEGSIEPLVMIRRGDFKFIYAPSDPCLLFNVTRDPEERNNLATEPAHHDLLQALLAETQQRWDMPRLHAEVLASQRRRRLVAQAMQQGRTTHWNHQPVVDANEQYMRNHMDLDDLERRARFPSVASR